MEQHVRIRSAGEGSQDLSFEVGEELIIIEPDSVMFWYVAQNSRGERGIIPITLVEVSYHKWIVLLIYRSL